MPVLIRTWLSGFSFHSLVERLQLWINSGLGIPAASCSPYPTECKAIPEHLRPARHWDSTFHTWPHLILSALLVGRHQSYLGETKLGLEEDKESEPSHTENGQDRFWTQICSNAWTLPTVLTSLLWVMIAVYKMAQDLLPAKHEEGGCSSKACLHRSCLERPWPK